MISQEQNLNPQSNSLPSVEPSFYDFAVDNLSPKKQTVWRFNGKAKSTLRLTNKSNRPAAFQITGQGDVADSLVEFIGPSETVSRLELKLAAGETASVPVRVLLPAPRLLGLRRQQFFFTVTTTLLDGAPQNRPLLGQITRPPLAGPGVLLLVVIGLVTGLLRAPQLVSPPDTGSQQAIGGPVAAATPGGSFVMPRYNAGNTPPEWAELAPGTHLTYQQMFQEIATQYNLDWQLLAEIAYQESRFNPRALGRSSEMGLMQIHPTTWQAWAPKVGVADPYDPYSNVQVAAAFLAYLRDFCHSRGYPDSYWVLIGYNWGPNNLNKLFQQQGNLDQVPDRPRQYALRILQLEPDAAIRRQAQLESLVATNFSGAPLE